MLIIVYFVLSYFEVAAYVKTMSFQLTEIKPQNLHYNTLFLISILLEHFHM